MKVINITKMIFEDFYRRLLHDGITAIWHKSTPGAEILSGVLLQG